MTPAMQVAHGLGGRSDLPVPLWLAVYGAAAAVLISFFALGAFWHTPRFERDDAGGLRLPWAQRIVDARVTRVALRILGVFSLGAIIAVLAFGSDSSAENPGPTWFYVWFWIGLVPASLLFGPVWRALNPLRTISGALLRIGRSREERAHPYPEWLGYWPAAASIAAFVWLELVYDRADEPIVVLLFIALYALVHIGAGVRFGESWFDRGDGFEVYSTLLARLSPFGRDPAGRLVARNPFRRLADLDGAPGLVAFVAVVLGSTAFDGMTRTRWWQSLSEAGSGFGYILLGTAGLVGAIGFVLITYTAATAADAHLDVSKRVGPRAALPELFVHSLIPIAIGYTIAHYFSLFVFQGQAGLILASDPFAVGWDLFGTAGWSINYLLVSTSMIALVQVGAIVLGHVAGVVAAHDRALAVFSGRDKTRGQYPLLAVMVIYTCGGIALLVGT